MTFAIESALLERLQAADGDGNVAPAADCMIATATGPGRSRNQDRALLARLADGSAVAVVADGMGGMADGGGCAAQAVAAFVGWLHAQDGAPDPGALDYANARVLARSGGAGGTTLTAVVVPSCGDPWLAHAGDSRAYAVAGDGEPEQLSRDHNALAEAGLDPDGLTPVERMRMGAQITCAVGLSESLALPCTPVVGDSFLLTTDGVHDYACVGVAMHDGVAALLERARAGASHDDATALYWTPDRLPTAPEGVIAWIAGDPGAPLMW